MVTATRKDGERSLSRRQVLSSVAPNLAHESYTAMRFREPVDSMGLVGRAGLQVTHWMLGMTLRQHAVEEQSLAQRMRL